MVNAQTSEWQVPFLGITAHQINETWKQNSIVLGLELLEGSHTGINIAAAFIRVLKYQNVYDKPFFLTANNAANMQTMAIEIELELDKDIFDSSENKIPCIAYIINLAALDLLKYSLKSEATDNEEDILIDQDKSIIGSVTAGEY